LIRGYIHHKEKQRYVKDVKKEDKFTTKYKNSEG